MKYVSLLILLILVPRLAGAQASSDFENLPIPAWAEPVIDSFSKPLHPVIGGVASGGGLGFGVGYESPEDEGWFREAEGVDDHPAVLVARRRDRSPVLDETIANRRVRHHERTWTVSITSASGREPSSRIVPRSACARPRSAHAAGSGLSRPSGWAAVSRSYKADVGPGRNRSVLSIEQRFSPSDVPGFAAEPMFGRYRGFAELIYPAPPVHGNDDGENPDSYRGVYQVALEAVRDHESGRHDFHRWETETQQRIPGFRPGQRLTLHGLLATPIVEPMCRFTCCYTLGGSGGLKIISSGSARHRRNARHAAKFPQLPVSRSRSRAAAGGISDPDRQQTPRDGFRRCRTGRTAHLGAVHESPNRNRLQSELHAQTARRSDGWMLDLAAAKAFRCSGASGRSRTRRPPACLLFLLSLSALAVFAQSCSKTSRKCFAAARSFTMTPTSRRLSSSTGAEAHAAEEHVLAVAQHCAQVQTIGRHLFGLQPFAFFADLADDAHVDTGLGTLLKQLDHLSIADLHVVDQ